jgi:hypothetical protein
MGSTDVSPNRAERQATGVASPRLVPRLISDGLAERPGRTRKPQHLTLKCLKQPGSLNWSSQKDTSGRGWGDPVPLCVRSTFTNGKHRVTYFPCKASSVNQTRIQTWVHVDLLPVRVRLLESSLG